MPFKLYISTKNTPTGAAVISAVNPTAIVMRDFIVGNTLDTNIYLVDGLGAFDSASGAAGYTLTVRIGLPSAGTIQLNGDWTPITNGWNGNLAFTDARLADLFDELGTNPVKPTLEIEVSDTQGRIVSELQLPIKIFRNVSQEVSINANPDGTIQVFSNGVVRAPWGLIDTTGTTTAGIQEAIDALDQVEAFGYPSGGGRIILGPGTFTCSGGLVFPTQYPFNLVFEGSGEIATLLKYTGTGDFITMEAAAGPPSKTLNLVMRNLGLAYVNDTAQKRLVYFDGSLNQGLIENCLFTVYQALTFVGGAGNAGGGSNLVYINGTPANKVGTIGLQINGGTDNKVVIKKCAFWALAIGCWYGNDHGTIEDCIFANCGHWWSNGTPSTGTAWTTTTDITGASYFRNIAAYGVGLVGKDGTYELNVSNCHFFECHAAFANICLGGFGPQLKLINPLVESCEYRLLHSLNVDGEDFSRTSIISMTGRTTGTNGTGYIAVNTGAVTGTSPYNESAVNELVMETPPGGFNFYCNIGAGELQVLSLDSSGAAKLPSLTKTARNALGGATAGYAIYQTTNTPGLRVFNGTHWVRFTETNDD